MKYKKLYTAGDGFCFNHVWPMWSKLLAEILECEWVNLSTYGAGNETIANLVIDQLSTTANVSESLWLIQWTGAVRMDLRIDGWPADYQIYQTISTDPVYYDNFVTSSAGKKYWCSSASVLPIATDYKNFLHVNQHIDRSQLSQLAVVQALTQRDVDWKFLLSFSAPWAKNRFIDDHRWVPEDMQSFRRISKYKHLDKLGTQPASSVHLDFLETFILPGLEYNKEKLEELRIKMIEQDTLLRLKDSANHNI